MVENVDRENEDRQQVIAGISAVNNSLRPYFDTTGIFVQSHPEYAAIMWGTLHLMFMANMFLPA
jgi:hypothetical protein